MISRETHSHVLFALRRILRALARVLIHAGIRFEDFSAVAREVYIESGIRDSDHPHLPSRARVAALTGLTRRDIDHYLDRRGTMPGSDPALMFLVVEVLRTWHTNPRFLGPYGIPLELQLAAPEDRCFRSLVQAVDPKANPDMVLEELLRTGAVAQSGQKHFRAISRSVVLPEAMSPQRIEYHGKGLSRLAATLEYNMDRKHSEKRPERRVSADRGLPVELVPAFEKYARGKATDFLLDLDNWLASQAPEESDAAGELVDAGVNVFLYIESGAQEGPLAALLPATDARTRGNG